MEGERERFVWIDFAKSISIVGVITIHTVAILVLNIEFGSKSWWFGNIIDSSVRWAVPLFIMMSGYTLLGKKESTKYFFLKRLSRVGVPFIVWTIVYFLWDHFYNGIQLSFQLIMERFFSGSPYVHLYFFSL